MSRGARLIAARIRRHPLTAAAIVIAAILAVAMGSAIPLLTGRAIDSALHPGSPAGSGPIELRWIIAGLVALALVEYGLNFARRYLAARLAASVQHDVRTDALRSLQSLDGPGQDAVVTGQVVSRSISDLSAVYSVVVTLPMVLNRLTQLIFTLGVMVVISPSLTVIALGLTPVLVALALRSRRHLYAATWSAQQAAAEVATHVEQNVSGVRVVKAFAQEGREIERLDGLSRTLYAAKMRSAKISSRFQPLLSELPRVGLVLTIVAGSILVTREALTLGAFYSFTVYLTTMTSAVSMLASLYVSIAINMSSVERIDDVLALRPTYPEAAEPSSVIPGKKGLVFADVHFGDVVRGLNLSIQPGHVTAVVGPAGAGKSVAAHLAAGFYRPDKGRICFATNEGLQDTRELSLTDVRRHVRCVFDEAVLMSSSIRDNITLGRTATDEQIQRAAQQACAHEFIAQLDEGYETVVGERGLTLSGGQRQRIALARALLDAPEVLILDDATSAVDASTESRILRAIRDHSPTTAIMLIAHRESSLALADDVVVMDEGRIVDHGALSSVSSRPAYRSLMDKRDSDDQTFSPADLWPEATDSPADTEPDGMSDQLRQRIDSLPPATEQPGIALPSDHTANSQVRLVDLFRRVTGLIVGSIGLMLIGVAASLVFPQLMKLAVDRGVSSGQASVLGWLAVAGLTVVIGAWLAGVWQTILTARSGERLLYGLRIRVFSHLQRLGLDYFERTRSGSIMTRMTTDIDTLSTFLQTGLANAVVSLGTLVGVLVMLVVTAPSLAGLAAGIIPVVLAVSLLFRRVSRRLYSAAREQVSVVNAEFQENVTALRLIQSFGTSHTMHRHFCDSSARYRKLRIRAQTAAAAYFPGMQALSKLASAGVLGLGASQVARGELSAGTLMAFLMYLGVLYGPIQQLGMVFDSYQRAQVSLNRLREFLSTPESVPDSGRLSQAQQASGDTLSFNDVAFAYSPDSPPVIEGLQLQIDPGETVAVVGATGAGKSTLVKLLARMYDPSSGVIRAGQSDIRDFPVQEWRRSMVQVPQDAYLFMDSVANNIRYGMPEASDADVEDAVRRLGALPIIAKIPGGFRHRVSERGRELSSGQRQVIALARAELLRPRAMLLDEATATLDPATEATFLDSAERITAGRTCVMVAHRLATARRADRVLVVEQGRVIEDGSHDQLLSRGGAYAHMWWVQSQVD
ncbi:ABC transporter ATP-binding protein [Corynebacterium tapiri]|uniref:ABC transporter ATP-binding protein n=1 Tax=Corynebacterium tapiri TaxID=1448266 RepID=A0A5C4U6Z2_9CORY|nr:ABC transporter ATP-binding protein [Corynebacterium tapiri]TNL99684.1 ABC transporter ATP-binding protein [Corynebacterium tapiri]